MNIITQTTLVALLVTLGLALGARAAEPPKGVGPDYEVSYQGKVVDELGQPLKDAKVALIGTALSAMTDTAGAFKIQGVARRGPEVGAAPGVPAVGDSAERFCPLEVTAGGCVARTVLPDSAKMDGMTVALWAMPVEGQAADLGRFAYNYRKGAADNPSETQFLKPPANMFRGFLWEEHRAASRVEVEFAKGQAVPKAEELGVISLWGLSWWHCPPMVFPGSPPIKGNPHQYSLVGTPRTTDQGTTVLTFQQKLHGNNDGSYALGVFYTGADKNAGIPAVRVYGQTTTREKGTGKAETVDIQ